MNGFVFVLSLLPGLAWLLFYLQEDEHPEPKQLLALVFFAGAASAFVAYFVQVALSIHLQRGGIESYSIVSLLILAGTEELAKFGAAWLSVRNNAEFDEPVDAMIYMVVAALGFATLENLGALTHIGSNSVIPSGLATLTKALETTSLRFVGATLLHTLSSALIGFYWAKTIRTFNSMHYLVIGILSATALHAMFNYLIIVYGELSYALLFVIIVGFFVLSDFEQLREKSI